MTATDKTRRHELQEKMRKAIDALIDAHEALSEKLSEDNMRRYVDRVQDCKKAQDELVINGYQNAKQGKRLTT